MVDKPQDTIEADKPITIEVPEVQPETDAFDAALKEGAAAKAKTEGEQQPPQPEKAVDDAAEALRRQLADRDRDLAAEREARQQAQREAAERQREAAQARGAEADSQLHLITSAIENANQVIAQAELDLANAMKAGDAAAAAKANIRMARAAATLPTLENGKATLEQHLEAARRAPERREQPLEQQRPVAHADPAEAYLAQLAPREQSWLRNRPREWITDPRMNNRLRSAHYAALAADTAAGTDDYFAHIDTAMNNNGQTAAAPAANRRQPGVSAPPSRSVPNSDTRRNGNTVTLSPAQRDAARMSGITEAEYAAQLLKAERDGVISRPH